MTQTTLNLPLTESGIEMAENDWRGPYAAGAFDWGGNLTASLREKGSYKLGYEIMLEVKFKKSSPEAVGMLDELFEELDLDPKARVQEEEDPRNDQYEVRLTAREDVRGFLELVAPYLTARHEQARIMLEEFFPALDEGRHQTEEGLVEVAGMLDRVGEHGFQRGRSPKKYDAETVAEDLGVEL